MNSETQPEKEKEFRCGYCGIADLTYAPYTYPVEPYLVEPPYGEWFWVEEEMQEAYRCGTCGSHCTNEEVYRADVDSPHPPEYDDEY